MFAVIETGGKQYKVQNGDVIYVEKLAQEENSEVKFQVVALGGENGLEDWYSLRRRCFCYR